MSDTTAPRLLVGNDHAEVVTALRLLLREAGFDADAPSLAKVARDVRDSIALRRAHLAAAWQTRAAQSSQRSLLPSSLPEMNGCRLAARWQPAFELGGDCYDVIRLSATSVAVSIADVCGKGLPAALVMSHLQASARAFVAADSSPAAVADRINGALCRSDGLARFVTFFYATYDAATRRMTFTNAGHNPPLLVRADGSVERLTTGGMVLGVFEHAVFEQAVAQLAPGDRIVLFTDGITEAVGDKGEEFGEQRLIASILQRGAAPAPRLVDGIFDDVARFTGNDFGDDATVVALAVE